MAAEVGYSELFGLMAETLLPIPNNDVHRQEIEKYMCRLVRVAICRKNNENKRDTYVSTPTKPDGQLNAYTYRVGDNQKTPYGFMGSHRGRGY
ncbi:hypothetical protein TorRG33x02_356050 [Trema orientale]|uniref:Uncharacterized protein n=1 Tax=Trema orientale TaxID=63057 RepID=A0A2P5A827_TREOI|nr:hypothetical protein TorRG33x02_356050 [Trema orientale]